MNERIFELLNRIGLTANRIGFFYISDAVKLAMENPERLLLVTKWLYPEVARHYGTTWKAVERDIRYEIQRLKRTNREAACQLLRIEQNTRLTSGKFIALLTAYFMTDNEYR